MKSYLTKISIILLFLICGMSANAQRRAIKDKIAISKGSKVRITMIDKANFQGILLRSDNANTVISTENGNMELITNRIKHIEEDDYEGKYGYYNPNNFNYIISPTGYALKKGEWHYKAILTDMHFIHYGVSNNFSIGIGTSITSLIFQSPLIMFIPKVSFKVSEKMNVSGEILSFGFILNNDAIFGGIGLAKLTYGNNDNNISLGAGITAIYGDEELFLNNSPTVILSGMHRFNRSLYFISENYMMFVDGLQYVGVQGIRLTTRKNSFDLGAILLLQSDFAIPIPIIGYSRTF